MKKLLISLLLFASFGLSAQVMPNFWSPTSGTDTYTVYIPNFGTISNKIAFVRFTNTNTGAATININSTGATTLKKWDGDSWENLEAGDLDPDNDYRLSYDNTNTYFRVEGVNLVSGGGGGIEISQVMDSIATAKYWKTYGTTLLDSLTIIKVKEDSTLVFLREDEAAGIMIENGDPAIFNNITQDYIRFQDDGTYLQLDNSTGAGLSLGANFPSGYLEWRYNPSLTQMMDSITNAIDTLSAGGLVSETLGGNIVINGSDTYAIALQNLSGFGVDAATIEIAPGGDAGVSGQVLTTDGTYSTWENPTVSTSQADELIARTIPIADTGDTFDFIVLKVFNTHSSPATGGINSNLTTPLPGIIQKMYHNDSTEPDWPAGFVRVGGSYVTDELNIIYAEYISGTRVEYWIAQEQ